MTIAILRLGEAGSRFAQYLGKMGVKTKDFDHYYIVILKS
jgi:hypothetical protein